MAAEDCQLKRFASLPVEQAASGHLLLDVTVDGDPVKLVLDTGSWASALSWAFVQRRDLPIAPSATRSFGLTGRELSQAVRVEILNLGEAASRNRLFGIANIGGDGADGGEVGLFGADYLANYDVEIDPAAGRVNLFEPGHCPGKVVYWAPEYFRMPLYLSRGKRPAVDIEIDGQTLRALIDTGSPHILMRLARARSSFDVSPDSAEGQPRQQISGVDGVKLDAFSHSFGSLTFGGITLRNPKILISDVDSGRGLVKTGSHISGITDQEDVLIGMSLLRQLHLFIAYSEPALYFTLAEPPKTAAAP